MSKAVKTDFPFDLETYTRLLQKAQGSRTQTEFARDCGLSVAYMCKALNGKFDKAPTPATIRKIAAVAQNDITEADLLYSAGYKIREILILIFHRSYFAVWGRIVQAENAELRQ